MHEYAALISRKYMRSVVTIWEQKNQKITAHPCPPPNLPQVLGKQTLSRYLSPVSVYSVHRTTYFNSHLVRRSLLSTAMQCICQSPLQNLTVLHTHTHTTLMDICTDIFPFFLLLTSPFLHTCILMCYKKATLFSKEFLLVRSLKSN